MTEEQQPDLTPPSNPLESLRGVQVNADMARNFAQNVAAFQRERNFKPTLGALFPSLGSKAKKVAKVDPPDQGCQWPPAGWYCSRMPGHNGPCAARPVRGES